ncbi:geranylgeranyl reductase family protein [Hymenobacter aerilatus]|uniref:Geranylgeranyl reductase family protein n=1 Tax=Hymenobacter aerilatus TaxID=2932251 RepID=A0A8T9SUS5_9BACT|nr:geranylgeranyl reductase family protein [Hymenobacter aerilatus]UOR05912.1 geranylgeranyl reductase family protein [Hymenobacter aerilatus]
MLETDICILGAGPGGATAALHLANAGQPCLLLDRATFPRDKICGDALSGKVINELRRIDAALPARLAASAVQVPCWGISFFAPNGRPVEVPFRAHYNPAAEPAPGHVAKRLDFDNLLIEQVRQRPEIDFREGVEVARHERLPDGRWQLFAADGTVVATPRLLLIANGAQSAQARQIGGHVLEPAHHSAGLRTYYQGVNGMHPHGFIELHFLKEFLPGYLWIFPLPNGQANVGVGMRTDKVSAKKINLRARLDEILTTHPSFKDRFAQAQRLGPVRGMGLPLGSKRRSLSGAGYLLLGDAGSLIDPFTGEGISHAMVSGRHAADWAARAVQAQNFSADFLKGYDAAVYNRLWQELRLSRAMQRLLAYPWLFNFVANRAVRNPTLAQTLTNMFLDLDLREQLRRPGFYLKMMLGK